MKKVAVGVVAVIALLLVVAVAASFLIPLDFYKPQIIARVKEATGRDLRIDGPVRVTVIPRFALVLSKVGFSNAAGAQAKEMVSLEKLRLVLKLMPLLSGEVVVDSFVLDNPVIELEIDKQGRSNWPRTIPPSDAKNGPGADVAAVFDRLSLGDVHIVNGTFTYLDRRSGAREQVTGVDLKFALPSLDQPFKGKGLLAWRAKKVAVELDVAKPRALLEGKASALDVRIESEAASLRFRGKFSHAGSKTRLGEAQIGIDKIKATGSIGLDTSGARPRIDGKLAVERLDLNRYLPPEQPGPAAAIQSAVMGAPRSWIDEPFDPAVLQAADAALDVTVDGVQARKVRIDSGAVAARLTDGRLTLDLTRIDLYSGKGQGKVALDATRAGSAALDVELHLTRIDAEPLLRDAAHFDRLAGTGSIDLALSARGATVRDLVRALRGNGELDLRDGAILGVNLIPKMLRVASTAAGDDAAENTPFTEMGGTFTIENGVLSNDDLALRSPRLQVHGEGTVDLNTHTVDFRLTPRFVAPLVGGTMLRTRGMMVPLTVRGQWDQLRYETDVRGLVEAGLEAPANLIGDALDLTRLPGELLGGRNAEQPSDAQQPSDVQQPSGAQPPPRTKPKPGDRLKGLFGR